MQLSLKDLLSISLNFSPHISSTINNVFFKCFERCREDRPSRLNNYKSLKLCALNGGPKAGCPKHTL